MSTHPTLRLSFVPPGANFPSDLYTELVAALFQPGMRMISTETPVHRYGWPVNFRELTKEQIENRVSIARLAQTCKSLNAAVNTRLDLYAHRALSFHMQNTVWAAHRFARKPYADRAEMHRLWWPERWPYESNADMDRAIERYTAPQARLLKLFVVWIHRRRNQLAVQVGIHEHEGPIRVFQITDHDQDEDASDTASDGDSISMSDSEDDVVDNTDENEAGIEDGTDPIQTELVASIEPPAQAENITLQPYMNAEEQIALAAMEALGNNFVVSNEAVLAALEEDESEDSEASETLEDSEEDDEMHVEMITAIDAVHEDSNDQDIHEPEEDNGEVEDRNPELIDLHYSATTPRWIDRERGSEEVTTAELSARVEAWIRLQYHNFFPLLNEPN